MLSVDEEAVLRRHYEGKLQPVCKAFSFPHKIQVTHELIMIGQVEFKVCILSSVSCLDQLLLSL